LNAQKELDPKAVVDEQFGRFLVEGKEYPTPLPNALKRWYCYASGHGHSIASVLKSCLMSYQFPMHYLELAPVKTVLRGYDVVDGYIVIDVAYSPQNGLRVPPGDSEL